MGKQGEPENALGNLLDPKLGVCALDELVLGGPAGEPEQWRRRGGARSQALAQTMVATITSAASR